MQFVFRHHSVPKGNKKTNSNLNIICDWDGVIQFSFLLITTFQGYMLGYFENFKV